MAGWACRDAVVLALSGDVPGVLGSRGRRSGAEKADVWLVSIYPYSTNNSLSLVLLLNNSAHVRTITRPQCIDGGPPHPQAVSGYARTMRLRQSYPSSHLTNYMSSCLRRPRPRRRLPRPHQPGNTAIWPKRQGPTLRHLLPSYRASHPPTSHVQPNPITLPTIGSLLLDPRNLPPPRRTPNPPHRNRRASHRLRSRTSPFT